MVRRRSPGGSLRDIFPPGRTHLAGARKIFADRLTTGDRCCTVCLWPGTHDRRARKRLP